MNLVDELCEAIEDIIYWRDIENEDVIKALEATKDLKYYSKDQWEFLKECIEDDGGLYADQEDIHFMLWVTRALMGYSSRELAAKVDWNSSGILQIEKEKYNRKVNLKWYGERLLEVADKFCDELREEYENATLSVER